MGSQQSGGSHQQVDPGFEQFDVAYRLLRDARRLLRQDVNPRRGSTWEILKETIETRLSRESAPELWGHVDHFVVNPVDDDLVTQVAAYASWRVGLDFRAATGGRTDAREQHLPEVARARGLSVLADLAWLDDYALRSPTPPELVYPTDDPIAGSAPPLGVETRRFWKAARDHGTQLLATEAFMFPTPAPAPSVAASRGATPER